ncbi:hypothetical protein WJX72_008422 [[Myrmecia] bisecta]|uniref:Protein kinase domain-containing protein n=1 Tax=[Myrmecia] bisecta TaxID=41462 RepID=A0AAW1PU55_9CHLO
MDVESAVSQKPSENGVDPNQLPAKAQEKRHTFLSMENELKRLTSLRKIIVNPQFWENLPATSKCFLLLSCVDAMVVVAFSIQQLVVGGELLHITLAMLVTGLFFLLFVWDAIVHENAFELLASMVLGLLVVGRVLYFVIAKHPSTGAIVVAVIAMALMLATLGLAYITWSQFGWRTYSKLACDMRVKNADERRKVYILVNIFTTLLKLDMQFLIILFMVGINVAVVPNAPNNQALIILNSVGFFLLSLWNLASYFAVKYELTSAALVLQVLMPLSYAMPIGDIWLVFDKKRRTVANAQESLVISAVLFMITRTAIWVYIRRVMKQFAKLKTGETAEVEANQSKQASQMVHPDLAPLMRGAWLGKPSRRAKDKKRFFQLSSDGSTLRWAWNKYILLYYVEEVSNNDDDLEITLKMGVEPDLRLKFFDHLTYKAWRRGLTLLLTLLLTPGDFGPDGAEGGVPHPSAPAVVRQLLDENDNRDLHLTPQRLLKKLGIRVTKRRSTQDPENQAFKKAAERAKRAVLAERAGEEGSPTSSCNSGEASGSSPVGNGLVRGQSLPPLPKVQRPSLTLQQIKDSFKKGGEADDLERLPLTPDASPSDGTRLKRGATMPARFKSLVDSCLSPRAKRPKLQSEGSESHASPLPSFPDPDVERVQVVIHGGMTAGLQNRSKGQKPRTKTSSQEAHDLEHLDVVAPLPNQTISFSAAEGATAAADKVQVAVHGGQNGASPDLRYDAESRSSGETSGLGFRRDQSGGSYTGILGGGESSGDSNTVGLGYAGGTSSGSGGWNASTSGSEDWGLTSRTTGSSGMGPLTLQVSVEMIEYSELRMGKFLGKGSEGVVYAAWYLETPVAVKETSQIKELEMHLHASSHDNVVALRGLCHNKETLYIVMEYCPRGTLDLMLHHTAQNKRWDPVKVVPVVRSIARGMLHLHTRRPPILHRDLKPGNIFVGLGMVMKVGDFGMSRHVSAKAGQSRPTLERSLTQGTIGTAAYCAPELMNVDGSPVAGADSNPARVLKADVYSFGVTLWEILERKRPYDGLDGFQIQAQWYSGNSMELPPVSMPEGLKAEQRKIMATLSQLVTRCTAYDPDRRPTFKEILNELRPLGLPPSGGANTSDSDM